MFDDEDEWLFESVKKYESLSMFDMQQPITAMEWIDDKSLCVATSSNQKHELLELFLPDKMLDDGSDTGVVKQSNQLQ